MRDYYAILRVARTATNGEIKAAYRQIALAVHPDVNKGDKARFRRFFGFEEEFKNATEAYGVLSDDGQRRIYDRTLGVRKVESPSSRWKEAAKKMRGQKPLYTSPPPPGKRFHDEAEWKKWHYGVDAIQKESFVQEANWLDLQNNRHQAYFRRQQDKEKAQYGVGRGHKFNASRQRYEVIERVRMRRELRLQREKEKRMRAEGGASRESASEGVCSIS
ncbi:unnamed protein product [Ascophyllum nodosum]